MRTSPKYKNGTVRKNVPGAYSCRRYWTPSSFDLTNIEGGVRITWTDIAGNGGNVLIFRSVDGGVYTQIASVAAGVQTYDDAIIGDHYIAYKLRSIIAPIAYTEQYQAVYDSFTTKPSTALAIEQNKMIKAIVDANIWDKIDALWLFAGHTNDNGESLYNWRYPAATKASLINAPTFTALEGFEGNVAGSKAIDLSWKHSVNAVGASLNNMSVILGTKGSGSVGSLFGYEHWQSSYTKITYVGTGCLYSASALNGTEIPLNSSCYISFIRDSATTVKQCKNKDAATDIARNSTTVAAGNLYALATNTLPTGSAGNFSNGKLSVIVLGSFSVTEKNTIIDAIEAYMDYNSKGIM